MDSNRRRPFSIPCLAATLTLAAAGVACASAATAPAAGTTATATAATTTAAAPSDWRRVLPRPELPTDRPLTVAFLLLDDVDASELVGTLDVFHHLAPHAPEPGLSLFTVSADGRPVASDEGLELAADHGFADAPPADILVVPGFGTGDAVEPVETDVLEWIRATADAARWVVSLRNGTFLLARAGLLDGLAVTTSPAEYDRFARLFPEVDLRVNVSFVHDGPALTAQGGARSFDAALYLVDHLFGEETAQRVADDLMIGWPPDQTPEPRFVVVPRPATRPGAPPAAAVD